mmetsp:Transcript_33126/g.69726  ORF Transcript_33126/g.69726 Transcript_33126/m.69726 type:complete len:172 (-) Transcript_33126:28-543(-)
MLASLDSSMDEKYKPECITERFKAIFQEVPNANLHGYGYKIGLRMTRGPTNSCIDFHYDGVYASSTSQIPLNSPSEYKGGTLCFFVNDLLHKVPRTPGSLVQHPPHVLHGVTSVTDGVRKSLFIVDTTNGLGENGIVNVTSDHVVSFLAQRAETLASSINDCKMAGKTAKG